MLFLGMTIFSLIACLQTPFPIFKVIGVTLHRQLLKLLSPLSCGQVLGEMSKRAIKILNSYLRNPIQSSDNSSCRLMLKM